MPPLRELLIGVVAPGAIVALLLGGACLALGGRRGRAPAWLPPLAFALAYLPADFAVRSWPQVWPADSTYRFVHAAALLGVVASAAGALGSKPAIARHALHALAMLGAMWMLLSPLGRGGDTGTMLVWIGATAAGGVAFAFLLGREVERRGGWTAPALGALIPAAMSPVLLFGSLATAGQVAGGLAATLAGAAAGGAVCKRLTIHPGGSLVLGGLVAGSLAVGSHFASVQWSSALLILASPLALWADRLPMLARRPAWQRFVIGAILLAIPLGVAVAIAQANKPDFDYF